MLKKKAMNEKVKIVTKTDFCSVTHSRMAREDTEEGVSGTEVSLEEEQKAEEEEEQKEEEEEEEEE